MSNQNIDTIMKVYNAFNAREYEQVLSYFDPKFEWIAADNSPLADKSPYRGIEEIRSGVFDRIAAGFEKLVVVPDEIFAGDGDRVVILGNYEGNFRGKEESFRTQLSHIWTLADRKPAKFQQYLDTLKVALDSGSVVVRSATSN